MCQLKLNIDSWENVEMSKFLDEMCLFYIESLDIIMMAARFKVSVL